MQCILAGNPKLGKLLHWSKQQRKYGNDGGNNVQEGTEIE